MKANKELTVWSASDSLMKSGLHGNVSYKTWCEKEVARLNSDPTRKTSIKKRFNALTKTEECCVVLHPNDRCYSSYGQFL